VVESCDRGEWIDRQVEQQQQQEQVKYKGEASDERRGSREQLSRRFQSGREACD
jgi:hypothetical protein